MPTSWSRLFFAGELRSEFYRNGKNTEKKFGLEWTESESLARKPLDEATEIVDWTQNLRKAKRSGWNWWVRSKKIHCHLTSQSKIVRELRTESDQNGPVWKKMKSSRGSCVRCNAPRGQTSTGWTTCQLRSASLKSPRQLFQSSTGENLPVKNWGKSKTDSNRFNRARERVK